ncbi:carbohydrate kinase family protein [Candidatus Profftella armatura (Diaphorina cf. continua)]|uniref:Carbohydrate kinase family protein n=1 Tax=Candidatus Profftella armatura (Diaphorina cf. continua) TaxID=2661583 RepID=A0A7R7AAZ0_9PROT|nr:carbohydrate kinase family protein [Candidatus Profftella armatura (Diaphorina cf. continua)]BCG49475.1 carbohydrate kinase family protein [Candidatus Profftella armatura (Diaphorina cf. continua)]
MNSLICGSLAFDNIMKFNGKFSHSLLPDQLDKINISFYSPTMQKEYGGCAGNIAYNLKLLNGNPLIVATLGKDGASYLKHLKYLGISNKYIQTIDSMFTAQCFIVTDVDNNQITIFHPGAMQLSYDNNCINNTDIKIAIISPDNCSNMIKHIKKILKLKIPFIFDPGQSLSMFNKEELIKIIKKSSYIIVNDYESKLLVSKTSLSLQKINKQVKVLIVTRGELGSNIFLNSEKEIKIPCVKADKIVDPTGCGDAFRSGILFGITHNLDWYTIGRLSNLMGAIKISYQGGQKHCPSLSEIDQRFKEAFGYRYN